MSSPPRPAGGIRRAAAAADADPASPALRDAADADAEDAPLSPDSNPDADELERLGDEESEGEDLLDEENYADDYKEIAELDRYEEEDLDNADYDEIDAEARRRAEARMAKRDREAARMAGRTGGAFATPDSALDEVDAVSRERRRKRIRDADGQPRTPASDAAAELADEEEATAFVNLDDYNGPLEEWIALESTRREIKRRFRAFLLEFKGESETPKYPSLLVQMIQKNGASLEVSFLDLSNAEAVLAVWVADEPQAMLEIFDEEATACVFRLSPDYAAIQQEIHVRITELPIVDKIRDLRQHHLDCLVRVEGVVTRRSGVFPQLKQVTFNCVKCRAQTGPYMQQGQTEAKPGRCPECQSQGPFVINSAETVYRNYQKVTLQEAPGSVPAGRVPRHKEVILLHDLIDSVSPGELVDITGLYKHIFDPTLNTKNGFPVFQTVIEANYVSKHAHAMASFKITDQDREDILNLSKRPNIGELIINSMAPSIYGHNDIKTALAMAMFSGEPKQFENGHRIRGDINVLVLGDPGTAKSQALKYAEKTSHRAVYTTGKGASAVGLTASVHRDPLTREWTLEGGALVLADQGICLIDEFDKMNDADRTSIHEAMEQQSISISKAGIITTLKARCSVIAAANPIMGRYDSSKTFAENVELTDAILSRFDILCVVRDQVDMNVDQRLADFVIESHMKAREHNSAAGAAAATDAPDANADAALADPAANNPNLIPQALLRKYILYARQHCHPKLSQLDDNKISRLYADLRRESMVTGGIPIAVRHIESILRMSEAHAKMHLRDFVEDGDVNVAIRVMLESFIGSQKFAVMRPLRAHFDKYLTHTRDQFELMLFTLQAQVNEQVQLRTLRGASFAAARAQPVHIAVDDFRAKAAELHIGAEALQAFYDSPLFASNGFKLDRQKKFIVKAGAGEANAADAMADD